MNRQIIKILRTLPAVILLVSISSVMLMVLSRHVKIEVTSLNEISIPTDETEVPPLIITAFPRTKYTKTIPTIPIETTTLGNATVKPRVLFDEIINPHPYRYKRIPSRVCKSTGNQVDPRLLILVKSNVFQIGHRMAIRATWGNFTNSSIQIAFLLGDSPLITSFTKMEYDLYEDMVQEDFMDEYKNNTLKTIMGFNWAVSDCSQAKFVLFVDDDYYVNIPLLLDLIENITESEDENVFFGFKYEHAVVRRKKESKWYVSTDEYPNKHWPPYISGGSMLLSMDVVKEISKTFPHVKQIFIDDVYLGIVAEILNITLTHDKRFEVKYVPEKLDTLITSHDYGSPNVLVHEWNIDDDEDDAISTVEQNSRT